MRVLPTFTLIPFVTTQRVKEREAPQGVMKENGRDNVRYYLLRIVLFFSYQRISLLDFLFLVTAQAIE